MIADFFLGDPRWLLHPVRLVGFLCELFESMIRKPYISLGLKIKGVLTFLLVMSTTLITLVLIIFALEQIGAYASMVGAIVVIYFCIAAGDLICHSKKVYHLLVEGNITDARQAVALMVGRDTDRLNSTEIARACVESVTENMVDGITAPLFWGLICSFMAYFVPVDPLVNAAFGFMAYKVVNTMDSMFGYKNERYVEFGWFAARFDDLCNFIPARLSGYCLIVAAYVLGYDGSTSIRVFSADRLRSSSPNSGHTEAAAAGALGIQLGGESSYFGKPALKPFIGEGLASAVPEDIIKSNRLVVVGSLLFLGCCSLIHLLLVYSLT